MNPKETKKNKLHSTNDHKNQQIKRSWIYNSINEDFQKKVFPGMEKKDLFIVVHDKCKAADLNCLEAKINMIKSVIGSIVGNIIIRNVAPKQNKRFISTESLMSIEGEKEDLKKQSEIFFGFLLENFGPDNFQKIIKKSHNSLQYLWFLIYGNKKFQEEIEKIRNEIKADTLVNSALIKRFGKSVIDNTTSHTPEKLFKDLLCSMRELRSKKIIHSLLKKYNISPRHDGIISNYILYGEFLTEDYFGRLPIFDNLLEEVNNCLIFLEQKNKEKAELHIILNSETSMNDIKKSQKIIKYFQQKLTGPKKTKPIEKFDEYKKLFEIEKKGRLTSLDQTELLWTPPNQNSKQIKKLFKEETRRVNLIKQRKKRLRNKIKSDV